MSSFIEDFPRKVDGEDTTWRGVREVMVSPTFYPEGFVGLSISTDGANNPNDNGFQTTAFTPGRAREIAYELLDAATKAEVALIRQQQQAHTPTN